MSKHDLLRDLEGIARAYLEAVRMGDGPTDVRKLARRYGLTLTPTGGKLPGFLADSILAYNETVSDERQRFTIAHELGHHALERHGWENPRDEWAASFVGAAILLPERPFKAALKAHRWDLEKVRAIFGCSWEVAAKRVADVRSSLITVYDNGEITERTQSTWIHQAYAARVEPFEHEMIAEALRDRAHIWRSDLCRAWFCPGADGWQRVILVVGLEEFEERAAESRGHVA